MRCLNCSREIANDSCFCGYCGASQEAAQNRFAESRTESSWSNPLRFSFAVDSAVGQGTKKKRGGHRASTAMAIISAIILLMGAVGGYFLWANNDHKEALSYCRDVRRGLYILADDARDALSQTDSQLLEAMNSEVLLSVKDAIPAPVPCNTDMSSGELRTESRQAVQSLGMLSRALNGFDRELNRISGGEDLQE